VSPGVRSGLRVAWVVRTGASDPATGATSGTSWATGPRGTDPNGPQLRGLVYLIVVQALLEPSGGPPVAGDAESLGRLSVERVRASQSHLPRPHTTQSRYPSRVLGAERVMGDNVHPPSDVSKSATARGGTRAAYTSRRRSTQRATELTSKHSRGDRSSTYWRINCSSRACASIESRTASGVYVRRQPRLRPRRRSTPSVPARRTCPRLGERRRQHQGHRPRDRPP
jgi:hypothetical protein